jgi:DNA replication and repair protein RecF
VVISQYDRNYLDSLNRYSKALQQRNSLLKLEEEPDVALLEIWEEQMAREGEFLYSKRDEFINLLSPLFQQIYQRISEDKEKVSLRYVSHCQRGPLLEVIQRDRAKDRIMGYSLHGVHRDDLEMMLGDYPMKREGSQGQNKTFVAALKLAQLQFLKTKVGTAPMLLLDDIFDKLDAHRVEQIIRLVGTEDFGQIFITDTNRSHIDKILQ